MCNAVRVAQDHRSIGKAIVYLDSLAYSIDVQFQPGVLDVTGKARGTISVSIIPSHPEHGQDLESEELIGEPMLLDMKVEKAAGVSINDNRNGVFVRWKMFHDNEEYETAVSARDTTDPVFNFEKQFRIDQVDADMLKLLETGSMTLEVSWPRVCGWRWAAALHACRSCLNTLERSGSLCGFIVWLPAFRDRGHKIGTAAHDCVIVRYTLAPPW